VRLAGQAGLAGRRPRGDPGIARRQAGGGSRLASGWRAGRCPRRRGAGVPGFFRGEVAGAAATPVASPPTIEARPSAGTNPLRAMALFVHGPCRPFWADGTHNHGWVSGRLSSSPGRDRVPVDRLMRNAGVRRGRRTRGGRGPSSPKAAPPAPALLAGRRQRGGRRGGQGAPWKMGLAARPSSGSPGTPRSTSLSLLASMARFGLSTNWSASVLCHWRDSGCGRLGPPRA